MIDANERQQIAREAVMAELRHLMEAPSEAVIVAGRSPFLTMSTYFNMDEEIVAAIIRDAVAKRMEELGALD